MCRNYTDSQRQKAAKTAGGDGGGGVGQNLKKGGNIGGRDLHKIWGLGASAKYGLKFLPV